MKFNFTPTRPTSPRPSATPHKRITAPAFDDDSSSSSLSPPSSPAAPPRATLDSHRIKNALFSPSAAAASPLAAAAASAPGDLFPWRRAGAAGAEAGACVGEEAAAGYVLPSRAPVAPRKELPRVGLGESVAREGEGEMRARGWRGVVCGGGEVVVVPRGEGVEFRGDGGGIGRGGFVKSLRVHAVAWIGGRGEEGEGGASGSVPGLKEAFGEVGIGEAVVDAILGDDFAAAGEGDGNARHAAVVFGLLGALYRREGGGGKGGNMLERVVEWAKGDASFVCDEKVGEGASGLRRALVLLTVGDVEGAVEVAVGCGCLRLAILIARAAESDKVALREDAAAQLEAYGLEEGGGDVEMEGMGSEEEDMGGVGLVTKDERLILSLLAGNVAVVARELGLSWYRLFTMELLYGAGSVADMVHSERVSAAVGAMADVSDIPALPPHGDTRYRDAAYHLLRLYADPTASYPLTAGVFAPSSFGHVNNPMDIRFAWHLHQCLSAMVPKAVLANAMRLSDAFAAQLFAADLPLWSFYVLCSGNPPAAVVKAALVRTWPAMMADRIEVPMEMVPDLDAAAEEIAEDAALGDAQNAGASPVGPMGPVVFLVHVMKVPVGWVHEARAIHFRVEGDEEKQCESWLRTGSVLGYTEAERLITSVLFPRAVANYDATALKRIANWLVVLDRSTRPPNWATSGGLILDYLTHVAPETMNRISNPSQKLYTALMPVYKSMSQRVCRFAARAESPTQRHAAAVVADGIASAERVAALHNPDLLESAMDDLVETGPFVSLTTTQRIIAEYKHQAEPGGLAGAALFVSALPAYSSLVGRTRPMSTDFARSARPQ